MKISIITPAAHGGSGGIALYNANLINVLSSKKEIESIYLFSKTNVKLNNNKVKTFYSSNHINFFILIILNIINIFKSKIVIVSHINLIPYLIIPILFNKKIILLSYGLEIWGVSKNFIYKLLIKRINFFICMRNYTMETLKKKYNLKNKNFHLLPNCIKLRKLGKLIKNIKKKNIITIARLSRLEKYKGIDETLEALALLKKINFYYFVVGDGDDKERLILKAKKLNLMNNVKFFGKVSNKRRDQLLANSSIISMPGSDKTFDTYPFRFAFLEAAEFGLKIIGSTPKGAEKNCNKKYKNLNFVNPKKTKQILEKILKLQKQKKQIDKKYLNDFSFDNFKNKLNNILLEIN